MYGITNGDARARPGGLFFVLLAAVVACLALFPWMLAAAFAPAMLGAPGADPSPLTILSIAAVLSYPIWLVYWGRRVMSARKGGDTGKLQALVMAAPGLILIGVFTMINFHFAP